MNDALQTATSLCGFNSMVLEIQEKKDYVNDSNIKDVTKIHCIQYIEVDGKLKYYVWQYYRIGDGKQYNIGCEPISLKADIAVPFQQEQISLRNVGDITKNNDIIYYSEPMCIKSFPSVEKMLQHLDFEKHDFGKSKVSTMEKKSKIIGLINLHWTVTLPHYLPVLQIQVILYNSNYSKDM